MGQMIMRSIQGLTLMIALHTQVQPIPYHTSLLMGQMWMVLQYGWTPYPFPPYVILHATLKQGS